MHQYVALLRGINVGGKNIIPMTELRACFEAMGVRHVRTYIQSGNVLFESSNADVVKLTVTVEQAFRKTFAYEAKAVVVSHEQLKTIVAGAPKGFGADKEHKYNVVFLRAPLTAGEAVKNAPVKEGVDVATAGQQVLYFSTLVSKATSSRFPRLVGTPAYQYMTIRNWNTTVKLLALMEAQD